MIEKIKLLDSDRSQNTAREKINELIEASNRQDRVIALLCRNIPGGMAQHLRAVDEEFYSELGRSEEDERERDLMGSDHG